MHTRPRRRARHLAALAVLAALIGCDDDPADPAPDNFLIVRPDVAPPDPDLGPDSDMAPLDPDLGPDPDMAPAPDVMPPDMAPPDMAPVPACANGADDDGDGAIDYPLDPGCEGPDDPDEADPEQPACANGADDDEDGRTDHPDDPGCADLADPSEASVCGAPPTAFVDITGLGRYIGDTTGLPAAREACRNNLAPEQVLLFTLRDPVDRLRIDTRGSSFDTLLGVYRDCAGLDEVACNDDIGDGLSASEVIVDQPPVGDYFIVVDGFAESAGPFVVNVRAEVPDGAPCVEPVEGEPAPALGCGRGRICRAGVCTVALCANGRDDDGDGVIDHPNEPGCESPTDDDETDPEVPPQCADGVDNDFDFDTDYPADRDCTSAADDDEDRTPDCSDGRDNDSDGLIDLDDPGCNGDPDRFSEFNTALCRNFQDDDGDGLTDYPDDPGCDGPNDQTEVDPDEPAACSDGVDDDEDGLVDYPEDAASCLWAADPDEDDPCPRTAPRDITGQVRTAGNTAELRNDFIGACQPNGSSNEQTMLWRVTEGRALDGLVIDARDSAFDTVLYALDACGGAELACDDNSGAGLDARIELEGPFAPGESIWVVLDGTPGSTGIWRVRIETQLAAGADCGPPGTWTCGPGLECRETADGLRCARAACADMADNDGDGLTDFPADPGCASDADGDEVDPVPPPACGNGADDDEDGLIDWPDDPQCAAAADDFEGPDCADGRDNDGDGGIDYDRDGDGFSGPNRDFDCACPEDATEDVSEPACSDGCDNDGDGRIDLDDIGCLDAQDFSEFNLPECEDGLDNDGDGFVDFPRDPGCADSEDPEELTPEPPPACGNGLDDDEDGAIDFPADDGCFAAGDADEGGPCDAELPVFPADAVTVEGSTLDRPAAHVASCTFQNSPDEMWRLPVPYAGRVSIDTDGSGYDTTLYARAVCGVALPCPEDDPECAPEDSQLACNDDALGFLSRVDFQWPGGGDVFVVVDGFGGDAGPYRLNVSVTYPLGGQCGPDLFDYAACEAGSACLPDDAAGVPTCQEP